MTPRERAELAQKIAEARAERERQIAEAEFVNHNLNPVVVNRTKTELTRAERLRWGDNATVETIRAYNARRRKTRKERIKSDPVYADSWRKRRAAQKRRQVERIMADEGRRDRFLAKKKEYDRQYRERHREEIRARNRVGYKPPGGASP